MDMLQVFHMNGGEGKTSYANNCIVQAEVISITKPIVEAAIHDYLNKDFRGDTLTIAELGCASGPTVLDAVTRVIDVVKSRRQKSKFMVYLNDLPSNDFNKVFKILPSYYKKLKEEKGVDFGSCFIAGLPGNFYERLLPNPTLDFVHSSSSLHWLSQVPPGLDGKDDPNMLNKGKLYITVTSPCHVIEAYQNQFRNDFTLFLKCRSKEAVSGGRMVLAFMGRKSREFTDVDCNPFDFVSQALMTMVSEGLIEEEKVDSLNVPYYGPSLEEVKKLIGEESSFYGDHFEVTETEWNGGSIIEDVAISLGVGVTKGSAIAQMHRAVVEPMLGYHFGEGRIMDELFRRYGKIVDEHLLSNGSYKMINLVISLIRI